MISGREPFMVVVDFTQHSIIGNSFQVGHEVAHLQRRVRACELRRRRHEEAALRQPGESSPSAPAAIAASGLPTLPEGSHARDAEQEPKSRGGKWNP